MENKNVGRRKTYSLPLKLHARAFELVVWFKGKAQSYTHDMLACLGFSSDGKSIKSYVWSKRDMGMLFKSFPPTNLPHISDLTLPGVFLETP